MLQPLAAPGLRGYAVFHLLWAAEKPTLPGWKDRRQNVHAHSFYFIHEGTGTFAVQDDVYEVEGGTAVYLKPGLQMDMASSETHPLQMTMIVTDLLVVPRGHEGWGGALPAAELALPFLRKCSVEESGKLAGMFRAVVAEWVPGAENGGLSAQWRMLELADALHRCAAGSGDNGSSPAAFVAVKTYLERHFDEDVKLHELARRCGISGSYIRKLFAAKLGVTPKGYLSRIRNEHARRYLLYTNASMKEIASSCGYPDEYHFSKTFKRMNGMPPSDFRAQGDRAVDPNAKGGVNVL